MICGFEVEYECSTLILFSQGFAHSRCQFFSYIFAFFRQADHMFSQTTETCLQRNRRHKSSPVAIPLRPRRSVVKLHSNYRLEVVACFVSTEEKIIHTGLDVLSVIYYSGLQMLWVSFQRSLNMQYSNAQGQSGFLKSPQQHKMLKYRVLACRVQNTLHIQSSEHTHVFSAQSV